MDHTGYSKPNRRCWDPDTIFAITNPSTGYPTCVGQAVTYGRRCKRRVAGYYVSSANQTANQLTELNPYAAAKARKELRNIAHDMLCYQHGHQWEEVVSKWERELHRQGNNQGVENTKMPKFKSSDIPPAFDDEMKNLFDTLKRLQEELRRMKTAEQASSRKSSPFDRTSTPFSSNKSARGRDDTETDTSETDEAKEDIREKEKREARERAEKAKEREEKTKAEERAERARERAEKAKEEARRTAQATRLAEEQKWSNAWNMYNTAWQTIEQGQSKASRIPWPILSGNTKDVTEASVREFFQRAPPTTEDRFRLFSQETKRWHTDKLLSRFGREVVDGPDKEHIDLVTRVMVQRWKEARQSKTK